MRLYLSEISPINSDFRDESGQAIYKVNTPFGFAGRTSSISRILPSDIPGTVEPMKDRFGQIATVEHHTIQSSIIRTGGVEMKTTEYFRKEGWGRRGRHRAFTGPDGRDYKWYLGPKTCWLTLVDGADTPVARFHQRSLGIIGNAHPPYLEIFPAGEGIVDHIVITFIFIEKMRKDKENRAKHHGASGGGP